MSNRILPLEIATIILIISSRDALYYIRKIYGNNFLESFLNHVANKHQHIEWTKHCSSQIDDLIDLGDKITNVGLLLARETK